MDLCSVISFIHLLQSSRRLHRMLCRIWSFQLLSLPSDSVRRLSGAEGKQRSFSVYQSWESALFSSDSSQFLMSLGKPVFKKPSSSGTDVGKLQRRREQDDQQAHDKKLFIVISKQKFPGGTSIIIFGIIWRPEDVTGSLVVFSVAGFRFDVWFWIP